MSVSKVRRMGACLLVLGALCLCSFVAFAADNESPAPVVGRAVAFDVSPPLSELAKIPVAPRYGFHEANPVRTRPLPGAMANRPLVVDTAEQTSAQGPVTATIGLNLLGVGVGFNGYHVPDAPTDVNLAVGDTQVVQWVNVSYAVFNKSTGAVVAGPILGNQLWANFPQGLACQNNNNGDIIAQWDKVAHRWLLAQNVFNGPPYYACIAISTTPDATGTYYRYQFPLGNGFPDYPKYGVWTNGYYETNNNFGPGGNGFVGAEPCVFNRTKMLVGDATAEIVCFQLTGNDYSLLPGDIDSPTLPPAGQDEFIIGSMGVVDNSHLSLYSIHIDWGNINGATITGSNNSQLIAIATFNPACNGQYEAACVPQKGTTSLLDSLGDRLMYRFAYYNDIRSLQKQSGSAPPLFQHWLVSQTVTASQNQNAMRWYEFRATSDKVVKVSDISVYQQGTFAPDAMHRWMGSIGMDKFGHILMGYSVSSANTYPAIAFTGRNPGDNLGAMQAEQIIFAGTGSQNATANRWGDYTSVALDAADHCTFWYTNQYYTVPNSSFAWSTRLNSMKFPGCH